MDAGVPRAATQNGGRGFCVGLGREVTLLNRWNCPLKVTFSSSSSRRTASTPSSNRARLSSMLRSNRWNSWGKKARPNPQSNLPFEMASSMPISPAIFSGWLNMGSTAPVRSRAVLVRWEAAVRKTWGDGL